MSWLDIEIEMKDGAVSVSAVGSSGERVAPRKLGANVGIAALTSFTSGVERAVRAATLMDDAALGMAQTFYDEVLRGELRDVYARMTDSSRREAGENSENRPLIRLFIQDAELHGVPWEALCKPGSREGFWGTVPNILVTRGVSSHDPWLPREITGAVRVLVIAPGDESVAASALRQVLSGAIKAGEIEWLEPIVGPDVSIKFLVSRLQSCETPHILHFIGHGRVDENGQPSIRLANDPRGEEVWMTAEALAHELSTHFLHGLSLVVLEACVGAAEAKFGSAAEVLAKAGADAVVAHLWPVRATEAQLCSLEIYHSLTAKGSKGDIGASVAAARRMLLTKSAEAFSPVLFLRGLDSRIFDFECRNIVPQDDKPAIVQLPENLQKILDKPPFTLVVGDIDEDRGLLRQEIVQELLENDDKLDPNLSLSTLTQRYWMCFGEEKLKGTFQRALKNTLQNEPMPLVKALGGLVPTGVHVTLLWRSHLERAIASQQPQKTIYALQVSVAGNNLNPIVVKRAAGAANWQEERKLPKRFDTDNDIVILRVYGGYSPESMPTFSDPMLTEDHHLYGLFRERPPQWLDELLALPRTQPGMFLGLSMLDWRSRLVLQWLYNKKSPTDDSLAILSPGADPREREIWERGAGFSGGARLKTVIEDPSALAQKLNVYAKGKRS